MGDLERAIVVVVAHFKAPNVADFLRHQSHEEVGYGRLFSTRLNMWNVGNTDEFPRSVAYKSPEDAGRAYCEFVDNGSPTNTYRPFIRAVRAGESDVLTLAGLIKLGGYATDATYAQDVANKG